MIDSREIHATSLLNALPGFGPRRLGVLLERYKTARTAVEQKGRWGEEPLIEAETLEKATVHWDGAKRSADRDLEFIIKNKPRVYLSHAGPYPPLLRQISTAPPIIYVLGQPIDGATPAVALVGSRRCSYYGERMARKLAAGLAGSGVVTISGLARGIDTYVHKATLEAGGATWAVIGSGLANLYPPDNKDLACRIQQGGAVISEFPVNAEPFPQNFPRRNRVIAGLSRATVVIEGGAMSGALITARLAAEEGRDVFAVPNPVGSPFSLAPHRLLKEGAGLIESAEDILLELGLPGRNSFTKTPSATTAVYDRVLSLIGGDIIHRDQLASRLQLKPEEASSLLIEMEIKGLLKTAAGGFVSVS